MATMQILFFKISLKMNSNFIECSISVLLRKGAFSDMPLEV